MLAHNEEISIGYTIDSVLNNKLDRPFELNLIANGCNDLTVTIAKKIAGDKINIKHIEKASKPNAWNYAMETSKSPFIGFIDADVIINKNTLEGLCKKLEENPCLKVVNPKKEANYENASFFMKKVYDTYHLRNRPMLNGAIYIGKKNFFDGIYPMPKIIYDDLYVALHVSNSEFSDVEGTKVTWKEPENIYDFLKLRKRIECGRLQLKNLERKYKTRLRFS